jgi:ATP-dependent DNA helicase DinG
MTRTKIPPPEKLGLPEKFGAWRSTQEEFIATAVDSGERVVGGCLPTGSGKSAIAPAIAIMSGVPTCIVTSSRALQTQYMSDFGSMGLVDIRGRNNYTCHMKAGYTCEDGYTAGCPYKGTVGCGCSAAEMRAATSNLVITNYDKWTSAKLYGTGMNHFQQVIFDEAHNCPSAVARAMQVELHHKEIEEGLKVPFLDGGDAEDMACWKIWASGCKQVAEAAMTAALARITGVADVKQAWVRHYNHMKNLVRRLSILATCRASEWVVDQAEDGYQFDPVRPGRYAEATLLLRVPKIIMMSATLRPKTLYMCGIPTKDFVFKEYASEFDPARNPIYYIPTMRVDRRAPDLGLLWAKHDQIAAKRRDRKGIVHTVSYARQEEIAQRSRFFSSMIVNPRGEPATETIELFKNAGPGTILVSPSVGEGQDFPDDQCRWQLVCKIPFEPPSKIVKAREADDKEYRSYEAMQKLVQMFGRGMRHHGDWCESVICDSNLDWFMPKNAHLAPRWFHGFFQTRQVVPPPLEVSA